jgi:heme exporter protein D
MNWSSWNDFIVMGGYARYVWGSVLVLLGCLAGEWIALGERRRAILRQAILARQAGDADAEGWS